MVGTDLIKLTAQLLDIYSPTGTVLSNKKITEADLLSYLNGRYREEAFGAVRRRQPALFTKEVYIDSWEASGVLSSTTANSITMPSAIFDDECIGAKLYNDATKGVATITSVLSSTQAEVDIDISLWTGLTYLLTGRVPFKNKLSQAVELKFLAVKYNDVDRRHIPATDRGFYNVYEEGYEDQWQYSTQYPIMYASRLKIGTTGHQGVEIRPIPEEPVKGGLFVRFTELPDEITDTTEPIFPKGHHKFLIYGACADAGIFLKKEDKFIQQMEAKFQEGLQKLLREYKPSGKKRRLFYRNYLR